MLDWAKAIHQAIGIESPTLFVAAFALVGLILFGAAGWIVDRGYRVRLKELAAQAAPPIATVAPQAVTSSTLEKSPGTKPQTVVRRRHSRLEEALPTPRMGSDNTILNAPLPTNMGDGNTIVGATDASGNTTFNKGGTAIGRGACADSTSIAIGAGAGGGNCSRPDPSIQQKHPGTRDPNAVPDVQSQTNPEPKNKS